LVDDTFYADSFSEQWIKFKNTQLDTSQLDESKVRFTSEISDLKGLEGKTILEVGSGAGRFINLLATEAKPALLVGIDPSEAVYSSFDSVVNKSVNFLIVRCSVYNLPFKCIFDFSYSIGVLHHTPDPFLSFKKIGQVTKVGGKVALSLYENNLFERPNRTNLKVVFIELLWALNFVRVEFFRLFTTKVPYRVMFFYCKFFVPMLHYINKVPVIRYLRYLFPSTCYRNLPVEWSMVDTMDTYSTEIVHQYRCRDIYGWYRKMQYKDINVMNSRAGWVSVNGTSTKLSNQGKEINIPTPRPI